MPEAESRDRIALSSRLRHRAVGDEGVLVHLDSGRVIVVNEVGLFIIQQLAKPISRADLVQAVVDEFEVGPQEAERDMECFLDELGGEQLLAADATDPVQ
ncbi:MAG: PqqD family protein [Pseudomonadales bacterium]|nr:PqqD family protein [Halioglobus sp.]MCP5129128.1 PqqD family protein [Pseudomonadales bacterium]